MTAIQLITLMLQKLHKTLDFCNRIDIIDI